MSVKVVVEIEKSLLDACAAEGKCQWCRTPTNRFVSSQSGANYFCARCVGPMERGEGVTTLGPNQASLNALAHAVLEAAGYKR